MRYIITICLLLISFQVLAERIKCFSNGTVIYNDVGKNLKYGDGILVFKETKSGKIVFISADCVVRVKA